MIEAFATRRRERRGGAKRFEVASNGRARARVRDERARDARMDVRHAVCHADDSHSSRATNRNRPPSRVCVSVFSSSKTEDVVPSIELLGEAADGSSANLRRLAPLRRATRHDGRATLHGTRAHAHRHGGGGGGDVGIEPCHLRRRRRFLRRGERAAPSAPRGARASFEFRPVQSPSLTLPLSAAGAAKARSETVAS